jgi:hypothetical protein
MYSAAGWVLRAGMPGAAAEQSYLTSQTIAPASTLSQLIPGYAYADQGYNSSYIGNCRSGFGCAIGLTFNQSGALQYVDAGLPMSVLCVSSSSASPPPPAPPPADPPPTSNTAPPTSESVRPPGSQFVSLSSKAKLFLSAAACNNIAQFPNPFKFQFQGATVLAWQRTVDKLAIKTTDGSSPYMLNGDIAVTNLATSCAKRRSLLQGASTSIDSDSNLPNGVSLADAQRARGDFQAASRTAYTTGQFASNYAVTGAEVTVSEPVVKTAPSPSSSSTNLALALGLGLGLGIPIVIGGAAGGYYVYSKRAAQDVVPTGGE